MTDDITASVVTFQEGAATKVAMSSHTVSTSTFPHGYAVVEYAGVDEQCTIDQKKKTGACRRVMETIHIPPGIGYTVGFEPVTTKTTYWTGALTPIATLTVNAATLAVIGASPTTTSSRARELSARCEVTIALFVLPCLFSLLL